VYPGCCPTTDISPRGVSGRAGGGHPPTVVPDADLQPQGMLSLPAGSYRLLAAAGHGPTIYYPFLVHAGRRTDIQLTLPAQGSVPAGFVFIPAGPFLLGSADDESLRTAQIAPPLHEGMTGAFLISQSEVTFAQWIDFLDAEGPRHSEHWPSVESSKGLVRLRPDKGHWKLQLRPTDRDYVAEWGAPIRYEGRDRLSVQDWRNFPVTGISLVDIEAYLHWLDASSRLPGARLCTEWEWERAARGADSRLFTIGNSLPASAANIDVTYGRNPAAFGPDEVGSHPESDSPFGLQDMQGNSLEIVAASRPDEPAVGRGGCWYYDANFSGRITSREVFEPQTRAVYAGFRACASAR
jgi:formylglycine-generating enzyme required for sulfatase activity